MILDFHFDTNNRWLSIDEVLPYPQYSSGAKDEQKPVYVNAKDPSSNPVLLLEFDILNEYGFGLKKGYYEIATDSEYKTLMFVESGEIKAKIPVIKQEAISKYGTDYEWADDKDKNTPNTSSKSTEEEVKVYSKEIYRPKFSPKELKKRKEKYKKGQDPAFYFHSKCSLEYDRDHDVYTLIWEKYNTRLIGIIKLK